MESNPQNPSKFEIWRNDFWEFLLAMWPSTAGFITGGSIAAMIAIITAFGVTISHWLVWALIALALFASAFNAYRKQRRVVEIKKINFHWPLIFASFTACIAVVMLLVKYEFVSPLVKKLTQPDFYADEITVGLSDSFPDVTNHLVSFDLTVFNNGAPGVIRNWELKITGPDHQSIYPLGVLLSQNLETNLAANGSMTTRSRADSFFEGADGLPIERYGKKKGFLIFTIPNVSRAYLQSDETKYELSFWDTTGKQIACPPMSLPPPNK
jgi:hypothetical protein